MNIDKSVYWDVESSFGAKVGREIDVILDSDVGVAFWSCDCEGVEVVAADEVFYLR